MVEVGAPRAGETDLRRNFGRLVVCGAISQYNAEGQWGGLRNLDLLFRRSPRSGVSAPPTTSIAVATSCAMLEWTSTGAVLSRETVVEGIERAAGAFIGLFRGENVGKMIVALDS